jgi:hypothetical protein
LPTCSAILENRAGKALGTRLFSIQTGILPSKKLNKLVKDGIITEAEYLKLLAVFYHIQ